MLAHEWRELEIICGRISAMRHSCTAAQRSKNFGLLHALKGEIEAANRQREQLIRHIAARLSAAAASNHPPRTQHPPTAEVVQLPLGARPQTPHQRAAHSHGASRRAHV